jgi:HD-like signal output (HDOD) protein
VEKKAPNYNIWTPLRTNNVLPEILKVVSSVFEQIPNLPLSINKIIEMATDEDSSLDKLVELVSTDPILVSNILSVVNSSYYGLNRRTDNIHLAIVLLGFKEVKRIAVKSHFSRIFFKGEMKGYSTRELWEHSYLVSICAENLTGIDDPQRRGVLLTLGLLHDIGKFALYNIGMVMKKMKITTKGLDGISPDAYLLEREELLFGVNHSIVGGLLARKWNLSDRTVSVIEYHHYPSFFGKNELPQEFEEDIAIICISDLVVSTLMKMGGDLPVPHPQFFEELGLNPSLDSIVNSELVEKIENAKKFINNIK